MKRRKWLRYVLALLGIYFFFNWLSSQSGLINQFHLHRANLALAHELDSLNTVRLELDRERSRLQSDTLYLERVARAQLGWARPGEQVFRFYADSLSPAAALLRKPRPAFMNVAASLFRPRQP